MNKSKSDLITQFEKAISKGDIEHLKKLTKQFTEHELTSNDLSDDAVDLLKSAILVIIACKYNKVRILEHLFDSGILNKSSVVLPGDEDETHHNAFYYAIRSGNIELLDTLINKWPGNYFALHLGELDEIISTAYEELKLKNVPLSDEVEIFVESKLIDLRFFSDTSGLDRSSVSSDLGNIKERIELILQNVHMLRTEYSSKGIVDERFLFIAKFIAECIHVLKRQLKSTYNILPWEEMEFCLVRFVSSHITQQEINLFCLSTLNKNKILSHLKHFAKKLEDIKGFIGNMKVYKLAEVPKLKREKVVADIISNCPQFKELYDDYKKIRDVQSLKKISDSMMLAFSVNPAEKEGQLIITRVLQIIGEHLKNTLESPKLADSTSELLLMSLSKKTRKIIIDLRNSLSHAYSLSRRTEIEENKGAVFFTGVQNDMRRINNVITDMLYNNRIKIVRMLLKKAIDSTRIEELKEVVEIFRTSKIEMDRNLAENSKMMDHVQLEKLFQKLSDNITDKTDNEKKLFSEVNNIINRSETKSETDKMSYISAFYQLQSLDKLLNSFNFDENRVRGIKFVFKKVLKDNAPKIGPHSLKEIADHLIGISLSVKSRLKEDNFDELNRLFLEIFCMVQFRTDDVKWLEKLREKLNVKCSFIPTHKQRKLYNVTGISCDEQLTLKLSELKCILENNELTSKLIETYPSYKKHKELQTLIEMLVLDIFSILDTSKHLEDNGRFLDVRSPLLIGKCLRTHLAHDNALTDLSLTDSAIAVAVNANKLTEETVVRCRKKIGKVVTDNPSKLREKFIQGLRTITEQRKMYDALEEGNLEGLKECLKNGTDLNARSTNLWTALHFAAKGPNLKVIKFILDQKVGKNAKDVDGQSPLHIAAAHGRKEIVEYFIKEVGLVVDEADSLGKTPLHIAAAKGQKDVVEVLLKNNAKTLTKDVGGLSPVNHSINNNHTEIAKILLEKDENVDINESLSGYTPLHHAAENGLLELVNFLLQNGANVNARNDNNWAPLHAAALNGHVEIVKALIVKGADVKTKTLGGRTALSYAVENGHEMIANILLKHGACVNSADKVYNNTPLHYAAKYQHEGIVKLLLKNEVNVNAAAVEGITPLHIAVQSNCIEIVATLFKHGSNIHAKDKVGDTPLHYAARGGYQEVAKLLIKNKADVNAKANKSVTPLHVAALSGHSDVAELLIKSNSKVTARDIDGFTPLHLASMNGNNNVIDLLIKYKAKVNTRNREGQMPLHLAAVNGHVEAVDFLLKNKAEINAKDIHGFTALDASVLCGHKFVLNLLINNKAEVSNSNTSLHMAIIKGHKEIVHILIANGADVNTQTDNETPLLTAIKKNCKEIVQILITNGAKVNAEDLRLAVFAGYRDIVEILSKSRTLVNVKDLDINNCTPLHMAAGRGHREIVNILISAGAVVDAKTTSGETPLHLAAQKGHSEVAEYLISAGAVVNATDKEGVTPLHAAAALGHSDVVEVLLSNEANINIKDHENRIPLELAVGLDHLEVVNVFLQFKRVHMNAKLNDLNMTLLHIASQESSVEMVKYLVERGCDINARNTHGSKPIHIAAREGHKETVEFFLEKGLSINELGMANQTLLHYAAINGQLEVMKYLIAKGAEVNTKDADGVTPVHIAALFGFKDCIECLLKNGAVYNAVDGLYRKPLNMAQNRDVISLLELTEKLFEAVSHNEPSEVKDCIKKGASVNAKNTDNGTCLHYAAWKGYDEVINILLQNKADPNITGNKGYTPLHYAAKFSHLIAVTALLSNGAVYNAASDSGKTPLDIATDKTIIKLFKSVDKSFSNVKVGNSQVISDLNKIKDTDTIKSIMCARNTEHKTLILAAVHSNFSKLDQLKEISQANVSSHIQQGLLFLGEGDFQKALNVFRSAFEKKKEILGSDNPGTLDVQIHIGDTLYAQGSYQEALKTFEDIFQKQKEIMGLNCKDTLKTRSIIALMKYRLDKYDEALPIFEEVYHKQKEILGSDHSDTLETQFHMALVLGGQERHEEALNIYRDFLERRKFVGSRDSLAIRAENNIAMVLSNQGKYDEALKAYKEVLEKKKKFFGTNHVDTLRTLQSIASILFEQKKYQEALKAYEEVLHSQRISLGPNHPETLTTQYNMANVLFSQGKWVSALQAFKESFNQRKSVLGQNHPSIADTLQKLKIIDMAFKGKGTEASEIELCLQTDINIAANNGDIQTVQQLLKSGSNPNDKDIDGRTALHYAVSNGHMDVVKILIKHGADVTRVTNKGNTPLHTATSKCYKDVVEYLLQKVSHDKLADFVNAKTYTGGATSLHVAAQSSSFDIVVTLLKHSATYNLENKESKTPADVSKDQKVKNLLNLVEVLFRDARHGDLGIISKLKGLKSEEFAAVTNARNEQGYTLLQVAIAHKHKNIVSQLLKLLKM